MNDSLGSRRSSKDALRSMLSNLQHLNLSDQVHPDGPVLKAHGGFCDVFQGRWMSQGVCIYKVAIKRLRVHIQSDRDFAKQLAKEIRVWSKLCHRNVLPLLGYVIEGDYPSLVSQWMENGTVSRYMHSHPKTNLLRMILGIAEGLEYLHDEGVIHSDIKADNVLVSHSGVPRICDFEISRMLAASQSFGETSTQTGVKGSVRWMAPELLAINSGPQAEHSMQSDVWAFGMTIYELLTKQVPYSYLKRDVQVMFTILQGVPPACPDAFFTWPIYQQKLWSVCVVSWSWYPILRKPMSKVVSYLQFLCRRADEDRYNLALQEESLYEFEAPAKSEHRQASILGQDDSIYAYEEPQNTHNSLHRQNYEFSHANRHASDAGHRDRDVLVRSEPHAELAHELFSHTFSLPNNVDESLKSRRSRHHHQRVPSLGQRNIIRDFDLRGTMPLLAQDAVAPGPLESSPLASHTPLAEQPSDLIKKWQESLRSLPSTTSSRSNRDLTSGRDTPEPILEFLSPHNAGMMVSGESRRSLVSSTGSSTLGKNTDTHTISDNISTLGIPYDEIDQQIPIPEPAPDVPKSTGPPAHRTLRRRAGTVSRIKI